WSRELANEPVGRTLLGRNVVLFRDTTGTARALGARCPHRGADLARGTLADGCIQCPFHGWRFDGLGQCVQVPSQPASMKISTAARVPCFPLCERRGVLWIWMGNPDAERSEPPNDSLIEPVGRSPRRLYFDGQCIDAPFLTVLENAFDKAHLPFIHRGTFGADQNPLVVRQRVTMDPGGRGLRADDDASSPWRAERKLPGGLIGRLARWFLGLQKPVAESVTFDVAGPVQQLSLEYPNATYARFTTRFTPADETHTWLFVESVRTRAPHALGDWVQRRVIGKLFEEGRMETRLILPLDPDDSQHRV